MTEPDETKTLLDNEHNPSEEIIVIGKFSSVAEEFETDEDRGGGVVRVPVHSLPHSGLTFGFLLQWKDGICHCCNGVLPFLFAIFCGECYVAQVEHDTLCEAHSVSVPADVPEGNRGGIWARKGPSGQMWNLPCNFLRLREST